MAEPGDPDAPKPTDPAVDHDELIGFSSAAALQGRSRVVAEPEPAPEPAPSARPARSPAPEPEPDLFAPVDPAPEPEPTPAVTTAPQPEPVPGWAIESPRAPDPVRMNRHAVVPPKEVANSTGLYAVYALILFAVPTLGVSALIALLAVTGRPGPSGAVAASHFVFQQRTLWTAAVAALLGAILIAVGLGVFVLFVVAVWLILRGASGVLTLKAGRPVRDPRGWFLA